MDIKISEEKEDLNKGLRRTEAGDNKRGEALQAVLEKEETLKTIINNSQECFSSGKTKISGL